MARMSQRKSGGLPLPKKAAAPAKSIPLHFEGKEFPSEVMRALRKSFQRLSAKELADGAEMFSRLRKRFGGEFRGSSVAEVFEYTDQVFGAVLRDYTTFSATVPVLLQRSDERRPELVGSGVLMRIINRVFLLTAAHVTDYQSEGALLIPGRQGFIPANGYFAAMCLPASGCRAEDKLDVAYFWLDDGCVSDLDGSCTILENRHLSLEASPLRRTFYTFAGFPWRKSRGRGRSIETDFWTFTGVEAQESEYRALGLTRSLHIVMQFHRKQAFHRGKRRAMTAPLPHGLSGGGVYAWDEAAMKTSPVYLPLAGIANEFVAERSLLIATRLHVYVSCIFQNQPDLAAMVRNNH